MKDSFNQKSYFFTAGGIAIPLDPFGLQLKYKLIKKNEYTLIHKFLFNYIDWSASTASSKTLHALPQLKYFV